MRNWWKRKHSQVENRKLINERMTQVRVFNSVHVKMKRSTRKNYKWPAKC